MTKQEFLDRLGALLSCLPDDRVAESQDYYAEMIDDRMEDGMSEEEAVEGLGSPGACAEAILDELPVVPRAIVKTRRRSTTLLWVLAILGSPIWLALAFGFGVTVAAVYVCIWILALCVWILAFGFLMVGLGGFLAVYWGFAVGNPVFSVGMLGVAVLALGVALLIGCVAFSSTRGFASLSVAWLKKAASLFRREERPAALAEMGVATRKHAMPKAVLLVGTGLAAAGLVIGMVGFALSGMNPRAFSVGVDRGTVVLGGNVIEDTSDLPLLDELRAMGTVSVGEPGVPGTPAIPATPATPAVPATPATP